MSVCRSDRVAKALHIGWRGVLPSNDSDGMSALLGITSDTLLAHQLKQAGQKRFHLAKIPLSSLER